MIASSVQAAPADEDRRFGSVGVDLYRLLIDALPQLTWLVRENDFALVCANHAFSDYFGSLGAVQENHLMRFHPDHRTVVQDAFMKAREGDTAVECEVRLLQENGHDRWHKMVATHMAAGGEAHWLITAMDVDDIVDARERFREATDLFALSQQAAGAGSWELDLRNGKVKLSRENSRLHGISNEAVETDLDGWKRVVEPEDAAKALDNVANAVSSRGTYNGEFRLRPTDGGTRWLSGIGRAYYAPDGEALRMIGLNFDITDRKTSEARLIAAKTEAEDARRQAEGASRAKGEFLASMSHEIRTPLNSIVGYTDLLMEEIDLVPTVRRRLEVIQSSGTALLTIVNDILDFSKIEAGQIKLDLCVFSPRALIDNVISMVKGLAAKKTIDIKRDIAVGVPDFVLGDESRLRQILLNFVNNALKFTESGHVEIGLHTLSKPGQAVATTLRFQARDTGIGIAKDDQVHLFERFSQVDASIARRFGGTGLGLAISKQLVELMDGAIGVESVEGQGSTFWFDVALPPAAPPEIVSTATSRGVPGAARRILLVEDVEINRDLARAVLESAGHLVEVAINGQDALGKVQASRYDVVLMDIHMPVLDGITATQLIRALDNDQKNVPIIAMTANVLPEQIASFRQAGMNDHVGKPFRKPELLGAIERWTCEKAPGPHGTSAEIEDRFQPAAFEMLEETVGRAAFAVILAKFRSDLDTRLARMTSHSDPNEIAQDARALIASAGLLGFVRLTKICHEFETQVNAPAPPWTELRHNLDWEGRLVREDIARYLAAGADIF